MEIKNSDRGVANTFLLLILLFDAGRSFFSHDIPVRAILVKNPGFSANANTLIE